MSDDIDLGPCCVCGTSINVSTIVCLPVRSSTPGKGWGCAVCQLPNDGAVAVVCDGCDPTAAVVACVGYPHEGVRTPIARLLTPFDHDPAAHREDPGAPPPPPLTLRTGGLRWFRDSPPAGDPACLCSHCGQLISESEIPIRMTDDRYAGAVEARFHDGCFSVISGVSVGR